MSNFTFDDINIIDAEDSGQYEDDCLTMKCPQCGAIYDYPDCWSCGYIQDNRSPEEKTDMEAEAHNG
jgi:uncharacterized OB-fold protein